ncbi:MAG: Asp-tRNA(Asn)/Glu-tRNA(Gln) amidotransferase subunit GatB [Spirochaetales bacterium]|nr:Asp-tRNA(Asn)/Glu-tRNA(Gln) amidotransferase subunit GatB [Spirochaetales bacterium]MCF7937843.1 Asp-tRNA(Asn)/Glu-tRNA(Gln) amidotransferase subunit GatB [Spirochaetales bacterium]
MKEGKQTGAGRPGYEIYIGLEIHIQLLTRTKAFCSCRAGYGDEPNTNVCPVCLGYPGVLPALNEEAVKQAYLVAAALNCQSAALTSFDRKNYFYPDMPKNYQISQFYRPIGTGGYIDYPVDSGIRKVRIHDVHLEEDAGKMIHAGDVSLIDYNRAGTPLLEIVTEPDIKSGEQAEAFLRYFRSFVRYLSVCNGNMEEGSLRCDANISLNRPGAGLGRKVELKNMNSSRFVRLALEHEVERQSGLLDAGETVAQETRLWNENRDATILMRKKEAAHDYRYFPEPDLPAFYPDEKFLGQVKQQLVELPLERRLRLQQEYGLSIEAAAYLTIERETADFFEAVLKVLQGGAEGFAATVYNWLNGDVMKELNNRNLSLGNSPLSPKRLADLLLLLEEGRIHGKIAKKVLSLIFERDRDPEFLIADEGFEQISDDNSLRKLIEKVCSDNPEALKQARAGEKKVLGYLIGQVMKSSGGRAEPQRTRNLLAEIIDADEEKEEKAR